MKSRIRIGLLAVLLSAATAVAVLVVAPSAADAAPPPDITPVKVAATNIGEGHAVYVRGTDARLYWRTVESFNAPGYSTEWRALPGGTVGSGPDTAQVDPDSVYLAAKANDLSLLVRRQDGTSFGAWQNLGGKITTAPVLSFNETDGRLFAFARGGDGAVWYRVRAANGTWADWVSIGGIVTSAPDVWAGPGQLAVFARGGNGNLYRRLQDSVGVWGPWEHTGQPVNSATSSFLSGQELLQWHRNGARHVVRSAFGGPVDLGGLVISAPDSAGDLIAAVGTNRAAYVHTDEDGWISLGGIAA